jgi:hypothetical protein
MKSLVTAATDDDDVIWLQVAVYDADFVGSIEARADLRGETGDAMWCNDPLSLEQLAQVFSSEILHDIRDDALLRIGDEVIDIDEVLVSNLGDGTSFAEQP